MTNSNSHNCNKATPPDTPDIALSVVIPAYNESHRIGPTLEHVRQYAEKKNINTELIVVDDGSDDDTVEVIQRFDSGSTVTLKILRNDTNRGKGMAVKRGMLEAAGDILLMCDADMSTPIEELDKLLPWIQRGYDVVIASRRMKDSRLDPPETPLRRVMARLFRTVRRWIMLPDIRDTQCGFKCFTRAAGRRVFQLQNETGLAFDCEILGLADRLGDRIKEVGVLWRHDRDSTIHPYLHAGQTLISLLRIRRRLKRMAKINATDQ